jgi:ech hydrogenase subunit A
VSELVALLIGVPLVVGAVLLVTSDSRRRDAIVLLACAGVAALALVTALAFGNGDAVFFGLPGGIDPTLAVLGLELAIGALVIVIAVQHRRWLAPALVVPQLIIAVWLQIAGPHAAADPERLFWFDRLSMIMVLIVGVVGTLICVHALGYMRDYQRSYPLIKGRRTSFFCLLFVFLSAMFGLVTANDLPLLLVFWEVTTLCSFLLIGYTRTPETIGYAFRALHMNLIGGLAFSIAILLLAGQPGGLDLAHLVAGPASAAVLPAIALLSLAGLTKSAQMPFSSWLIGAMYAPTPTSALLHSSTMVKAGVFLLLRLSPAMQGSEVGTAVAFVGMLTFLFVSAVAVTEQNSKKVLAYSTIANLGLIVGCAGIGGPDLVWVGVMLIVFHAVAKALLFLVVGTLETRLYTKDMEYFDALLSRMPRVSALALAGIAGMCIAPFGIVIAKWAAIEAFLDVPGLPGALFVIILAFGSSLTIFYWTKLMLKIVETRAVPPDEEALESRIPRTEWFSETVLAIGVMVVTAMLGILSAGVVGAWARSVFPGQAANFVELQPQVAALLLVAVAALPLLALWAARHPYDLGDFYTSGRSASASHVMGGALGATRSVTLRNYYLDGVIDGALVFRVGTLIGGVTLGVMLLFGTVVR